VQSLPLPFLPTFCPCLFCLAVKPLRIGVCNLSLEAWAKLHECEPGVSPPPTTTLTSHPRSPLNVAAKFCPKSGCNNAPEEVVDLRDGILFWSEDSTWSDKDRFPNGKPTAGQNVSGMISCLSPCFSASFACQSRKTQPAEALLGHRDAGQQRVGLPNFLYPLSPHAQHKLVLPMIRGVGCTIATVCRSDLNFKSKAQGHFAAGMGPPSTHFLLMCPPTRSPSPSVGA